MKQLLANIDTIRRELAEKGYAYLRNQDESQARALAESLGRVIMITDVMVKEGSQALVTSARSLDFHTDHNKAKYILWFCVKQTDLGGETLLADTWKILRRMSQQSKEDLSRIHLYEHKVFDDDPDSLPLLRFNDNNRPIIYYSFWLVKNKTAHRKALLEFRSLIEKTEPTRLRLQDNDILIIDNHRILHARTAILGSKNRLLRRYWIAFEISDSHNQVCKPQPYSHLDKYLIIKK